MKTTMPAHTADYLAAAMLAAVASDKVTPIITGAYIEPAGKALRATATDRYRCHEVTLAAAATTGKGGVILPAHALKWIVRTLRIVAPRRAERDSTTVMIETRKKGEHDTTIVISIAAPNEDLVTLVTTAIRGNFPSLGKLFDQAEQADRYMGDLMLQPRFLGHVGALNPTRGSLGRFKPTTAKAAPATSRVPGVVLVTYHADGVEARGLIQPGVDLEAHR